MSIFRKKSMEALLAQAAESDKGLKRTLGSTQLVALGIGAIIGAGLFVRTAAAAGEAAGPAVTISFIVAAIGCAFAGLCYAEFAAMIPIAGSAYTYAYATMGELVAWIIGWALILEYALGAACVSIAWSEYLNNLLTGPDIMAQIAHGVKDVTSLAIPYQFTHSPFESSHLLNGDTVHGIVNAPALFILLALSLLLIRGTQESAFVNAIIVFLKVAIVLVFIAIGWQFIKPANHTPYIIPDGIAGHLGFFQHGWGGILKGAGIVFFAFIGFDAVSTAAQEAKNPKRDMPIGILGSLVVCTILYILFSHVLTGVANYQDFTDPHKGKEASVAYAISTYMTHYQWLATAVTIAILAGFSSVILVMLMGQSRVFYSMSHDGLLPKIFSHLHPKFRTPYKSNLMLFCFVGIFGGFIPGSIAGDLTSIGTLLAFVLVCAGIWIMRRNDPTTIRPFKTPLVPFVPIMGMLVCGLMIVSLDRLTQISAVGWMMVGLDVYILFSLRNSLLGKSEEGTHHHARGKKSASKAGIACALIFLSLAYLNFYENTARPEKDKKILVEIGIDHSILVNQEKVAIGDLGTKLTSIIGDKKDDVKTVVAYDAKNDVKDYAAVLHAGENAKVGMAFYAQPNFPLVAMVIGGIQFLIFAAAMGSKPKTN
jgi:APA family basic amino acid/polyamine antiporter